tara:strand:+ start:2068 stop:4542 length:2475 start_codon:yes stop_codon:yes gene_type:complete
MKKIFIILILISLKTNLYAQTKYTISGYITDKNTGESIIGANIYSKLTGKGVTSNTYGFYSLTVKEGEQEIVYSFIGYKNISQTINLQKDINYNVEFELSSVNVQEIEVVGEANIVEKTQTSVIDIPIQQIKTIPALFGEVDVLKAIQLLPGVQSSEGTSGFYVRGGGPDQNLILLDGVPVYNSSHLGGLFSVFNADAIKTVRLTKGGFPARFGGRLSSVLQIDMKEGNMKEFKGDVTLGLISSKLTLEGPIIKNKTSFIVSARRTYADLLIKPFLKNDNDFNLYFYDLNAKINHKISNKDRIYLSAYMGDDVFNVDFSDSEEKEEKPLNTKSTENKNQESMNFGLGYGNITSTLRWNHLFSNQLFSNTTLTYSRYQFNTNFALSQSNSNDTAYNSFLDTLFNGESSENISFGYISGIEDLGARIDFDYIPNPNHNIKFGASYTYHQFFPGETNLNLATNSPDSSQNFNLDTMINFSERTNVHESFLYIEDDIKITDRLKANIGVHVGFYSLSDDSEKYSNLLDYLTDKEYYSVQPRVSARYLLNDEWSIKASYSEMKQNIHLLSNSSVGLPSDLWVPAIDSVPSQSSKQWAANVSTELYGGTYEFSIEGYYKTMSNLITYKEGYSNLSSTESWENSVETGGEGESYGGELFLQKKKGNTTGWIGYTLSWTNRRFDNINFGEWYPYKYDRRHDFSLVLSHKFNDRIDVGGTWVYGTGNAMTFPQSVYFGMPNSSQWDGTSFIDLVESYGNRNSTRMNPFHRLDLGINFHKKKKKYERTFSVGAYNVYNRKNPFFIYLSEEDDERVARQVSLFPIIPSISYRIKF